MTFLTLLPRPSFAHSLLALRDPDLEQQCMEALRLLHEVRGGSFEPSAQMWVGYEPALALYASMAILEWEARYPTKSIGHICPYVVNPGYRQPGAEPLFPNPRSEHLGWLPPVSEIQPTGWMGRDDIHRSHRALLRARDPAYGEQWSEAPSEEIIWP